MIIGILSGKGGVGKSTIALNLAAAFSTLSERCILIDADVHTPAQGLLLGSPRNEHGLQDVLCSRKSIREVTYKHPDGFHIIFSHLNQSADYTNLREHFDDLFGCANFIIVDGPSGLQGVDEFIKACDCVLVVTQPDDICSIQALQLIKKAQDLGVDIAGILVNAVDTNFSLETISVLLGIAPIHVLNKDESIIKATQAKTHVFASYRDKPFAQQLLTIADSLRKI
jgi:MinD-like ATPase involved in chromosome partitioning or flagellar assembly